MNSVYKGLLMRYQNYLIEFYQLIEDKEITKPQELAKAGMVKDFLENLPDFESEFEIEFGIKTIVGSVETNWIAQFSADGFSVRSFTLDDLDEIDEWYFHYHDDSREYEGNLFTDGDWDLLLEEIAEIDNFDGKKVLAHFEYDVS
ncbi:hypothetical protein [Pedobacter alpinus]|uniref:DUF2314 domain-containing protein n=1 Tax=Pedobacter alpinus TaxID=1590643 RepID=A0ABW5TUI4_9SPHI